MAQAGRPRKILRAVLVALLVVLGGPEGAARAQGKGGVAEQLLEKAIVQYGLADFEAAVKLLDKALAKAKKKTTRAKVLLYLGANYIEMGQEHDADGAFIKALKIRPGLLMPDEFKTRIKKAFRQVKDRSRGTLLVGSKPAGSKIKVDGEDKGTTPRSLKLGIGTHKVAVQGPGGKWKTSEVTIYPDGKARFTATFKQPRRPKTPKVRQQRGGRLWTWVLAGTAAAAAGVGLGMYLWADAEHDEWLELQDPKLHPGKLDEARLVELEDSVQGKEIGSWVCFGVAGAMAITSAVLFFVEGGKESSERRQTGMIRLGRFELTPVVGQHSGLLLRAEF